MIVLNDICLEGDSWGLLKNVKRELCYMAKEKKKGGVSELVDDF